MHTSQLTVQCSITVVTRQGHQTTQMVCALLFLPDTLQPHALRLPPKLPFSDTRLCVLRAQRSRGSMR